MLEIGPARYPDIDFRLEDCSQSQTVDDGHIRFGWTRQRFLPSVNVKRRGHFHFSHIPVNSTRYHFSIVH